MHNIENFKLKKKKERRKSDMVPLFLLKLQIKFDLDEQNHLPSVTEAHTSN
jgi:hypothetical protein